MKRKIYAKLVEWKYQKHHKPLIKRSKTMWKDLYS